MYPILYESSWVIIPTWHSFFLLSFFSAYFYMQFLGKKLYPAVKPEDLSKVFLLSYTSAYLGARALSIYVEEDPRSLLDFLIKLVHLGPMTFYGGFLSAVFCNLLYLRKKQKILRLLDLAIPSLFLGLSIGRIGCFFNGDDYGILASNLTHTAVPWWSVTFPNHTNPLPRVPVQLLESLGAFLIVLFLYLKQKRKPFSQKGSLGLLGICLYSFLRFFLEFLRGDERGSLFIEFFSTSQTISLSLILVCFPLFLKYNLER